jgi:colanic acid/amylovoran biosynthesis glycosyltransferase
LALRRPGAVKLAYLLNTYPVTSATFIRREIRAIEAQGVPVRRFAVRRWEGRLVEPADEEEAGRTEYLLSGNVPRLLAGALAEPFVNFARLRRTIPLWLALLRAARGGFVRHFAYLLQAIALRRRAAALGLDHVHAHYSNNAAAVAMLAHSLGGPGYSFTVHGPDELVEPARNNLALKTREAAFAVAISDYARSRIAAEAGPDVRIQVVRCGIPIERFTVTPPPAEARLVCVGRLCANKGQVFIPAAIAALKDEFPDLTVELVGDGEDRQRIEAEIERHRVVDRVRLSGWLDSAAVLERIRAARFLLLPSFAEGLPIVLMEALASGRPVLTTPVAGIPELVDEGCGWLFAPGDSAALASAIRAALTAPADEIAAKAAEGRERVERLHDVEDSAQTLLAAFREAAGGGRNRMGGAGVFQKQGIQA